MNRAWIPAGALAGVSVAGLLALGPVTDSLSTPVEFAKSVPVVQQSNEKPKSSVPVSVNVKVVGKTATAALKPRGGQAAASKTNTDTGFVSNRRYSQQPSTQASASPPPPPAPPPAKKAAKRPVEIGTTGEPNSDQGFAGGDGTGATGELGSTPGSGTP